MIQPESGRPYKEYLFRGLILCAEGSITSYRGELAPIWGNEQNKSGGFTDYISQLPHMLKLNIEIFLLQTVQQQSVYSAKYCKIVIFLGMASEKNVFFLNGCLHNGWVRGGRLDSLLHITNHFFTWRIQKCYET